jgi:hypothetical protein
MAILDLIIQVRLPLVWEQSGLTLLPHSDLRRRRKGGVPRGNTIHRHLQQEALLLLPFSVYIITTAVDIILLVVNILVIFTTSVLNLVQNCILEFKNVYYFE